MWLIQSLIVYDFLFFLITTSNMIWFEKKSKKIKKNQKVNCRLGVDCINVLQAAFAKKTVKL